MALFNEINRLQEKINRIAPRVFPPELKMNIYQAGEEIPKNSSLRSVSSYLLGKLTIEFETPHYKNQT